MDMSQLMKQAQAMQAKMLEMQEKMADAEYQGNAGGGMVSVTMNGKGMMMKLAIDPKLIEKDEKEVLEDLIIAAFNDAKRKSEEASTNSMSDMLGGMSLPPGFKLPF